MGIGRIYWKIPVIVSSQEKRGGGRPGQEDEPSYSSDFLAVPAHPLGAVVLVLPLQSGPQLEQEKSLPKLGSSLSSFVSWQLQHPTAGGEPSLNLAGGDLSCGTQHRVKLWQRLTGISVFM